MSVSSSASNEVRLFQMCDYIPLVSTATNLKQIFDKCVLDSASVGETLNPYIHYINEKSYERCALLLVPVLGNILVYLYDLLADERTVAPANPPHTLGERESEASEDVETIEQMEAELLQDDGEHMRSQILNHPFQLRRASQRLQNHRGFVGELALQNPAVFLYAPNSMRCDRTFVRMLFRNCGRETREGFFASLPSDSRNDLDLKLQFLSDCGRDGLPQSLLSEIETALEGNQDVATRFVVVHPQMFGALPLSLQNSSEFVLRLLDGCSAAFRHLPEAHRDNLDYLRRALESCLQNEDSQLGAEPFLYASTRIRNDATFALELAQNYPAALFHIGEELRNSPVFIREASGHVGTVMLSLASERVQGDREFVLSLIQRNHEFFQYASDGLRNDPTLVKAAVIVDETALLYASDALRGNRGFILELMRDTELQTLEVIADALLASPDFIVEAITLKPQCISSFSDYLAHAPIEQHIRFIRAAPEIVRYYSLYSNQVAFMRAAVGINGMLLEAANPELQDNGEVVRTAVAQNPASLRFASERVRTLPEFSQGE